MTDYTKLTKALRCCIPNQPETCEGCTYNTDGEWECNVPGMMVDAAAAIEALEAEVKRLEPKRGEWIETEEKEWGIYPFKKQTCSVCDCKIDHIFMLACMDYFDDRDTVFHYCPNCGAKMEVQK